jgi:hypothetical protein
MANNFWSEYNRLKKKNGEEAVIFDAPVRETATSSTVSSDSFLADSGASFWDEYERQKTAKEAKAAREAEEKAQKEAEAKAKKETEEKAKATEDIAPVKHGGGGGSFGGESKTEKKEEENKIDLFQKGAFADGYQVGDVTKATLGTIADIIVGGAKGAMKLGEGIGDAIGYGVAWGADKLGNEEYADKLRERASDSAIDKLLQGVDEKIDKWSVLGRTGDAVTEGIGQVGAIVATGGIAAGAGASGSTASAITSGVIGTSGVGSGMGEAYKSGATDEEALLYGVISGAADVISESIFGGLGKSVKLLGVSHGLSSADDMLAKAVSEKISNVIARNAVELGIKAGAEGAEEVIAGAMQAAGKKITYMSEQELTDILEDENLLEQFVVGALTSGVAQAPSVHSANKAGVDYVSGMTQDEQKVVDKVVADRVSEAEKGGEKLSTKDKNKIVEEVQREMEKGGISTDTIEEVLGGDEYKAYTEAVAKEDELRKEYEELGALEHPTLAQKTRFEELHGTRDSFTSDDTRNALREKMQANVRDRIKDSRLNESYLERTRRGEYFTEDASTYKNENARKTVENLVDSKLANNTRRTREMVETVTKIAEDDNVTFDFTNNEKLKAQGESKSSVNGRYDSKNRVITINLDSPKAWQYIVGHEVTHSLEGTDAYKELQNAIKVYAETKGEYSNRRESILSVYGEDVDIDSEITSDLVGEYLFTNEDFVKQLSTENRNLFQKIYDEIKHLYKMVTAGSKEARELERVKHAFEKAYRAQADAKAQKNTANNGASYSFNYAGEIGYVKSDKSTFVKEDGTLASEKEVFDSLEGRELSLSDGVVKVVKRLPGKKMYKELFVRYPKYRKGVKDVDALNSDVNYNMKELLERSEAIEQDVPDVDERHKEQGITSFDTRSVVFYDGERAYNIEFSIGILENGEKIAYAKKFFGYDPVLTKKIQTAEASGFTNTTLNQQPVFDSSIPQNSEKSSTNSKKVSENIAPIKGGNWRTPARELRYEGIAPVAEAKVVPDTNVGNIVPDDYFAPISEEEAIARGDGILASLDDADAPPEVDAPYYGDESEIPAPADPFAEKDIKEVGSRSVKAYMYENPEVKPFFQDAARVMLGDLERTIKGERVVDANVLYESNGEAGVWGVKRSTSPDIAYLLDVHHYTYAEIEKGIKAIIEDHGAENNAVSKRIEFLLNDRLLNGYVDHEVGIEIPPDQGYVELLREKEITEYNEEAYKRLFEDESLVPPADDIAPMHSIEAPQRTVPSEAPIKAPVNEPMKPSGDSAPKRVKPVTAEILTEEPKAKNKRRGLWSLAKEYVLDNGMVFEEIAKENKNRELEARWNSIRNAPKMAQYFIENGKNGIRSVNAIRRDVEKRGLTRPLYEYLYHMHNIDRMSLESKAKAEADQLLRENPMLSEITTKDTVEDIVAKIEAKTSQITLLDAADPELARKNAELLNNKASAAEDLHEKAKRYADLMRVENKPVFGRDVTADVSYAKVQELIAKNPELKRYAEEIYANNRYLRGLMVEEGVISHETAKLWEEMYPHYVPVRREGDTGLNVNVPLDTRRTGINAPVKRATGGNRNILPLFDTMGVRAIQTYTAIAKNRFGIELMETLGSTIETDSATLDDALDALEQADGLLQEGKDGMNPTFTVFENGERMTFEITDEMYDAMKPAGDVLSYTNKALNTASNLFRGLLTEYNPVFLAKNAIKDAQDILINSQHPMSTYKAIPRALVQMASKGKYYREYVENGGEQNTYFDRETATFTKDGSALEIAKKALGLNAISKANNIVEMAPRIAEYIASREAGRSVDVAMLDAARVTTNFAAGGKLTKFLNRNGATFLSASVNGAVQQARNVVEAKRNGLKGMVGLAAKFIAAGLPAVLLNHLVWDDDDEYGELSDYVKQNYYIVGKYGDGKFVRIPKGRTVAVIQNAFEQMEHLLTGDDEADLGTFLELAVSNLAPNNPLDNNIIAPIKQVIENKTWYGEDLVPQRLADLPSAEQYDESTDEISRWLGEKLNLSPYKINYLLNQYSGGVGDVVLPMLTPEAESGDDSLLGGLLAPIRSTFTTDSVMNNQNVSDFYDTKDKLTTNAKGAAATDRDVLMSKFVNAMNAEISELYAQKREVQNSSLTDDVKYNRVRQIQSQIVELTRKSLETYDDIKYDGDYAVIGDMYFKTDGDEWQKLNDDQVKKHKITSAAGDDYYATDGTTHYRLYVKEGETEGEWRKLTSDELKKQNEVTSGLGITPQQYWENKDEYTFAYEKPAKYAVSQVVGGYDAYKSYTGDLYDIKADKDAEGKSISGSRKAKVIDYINGMVADYGAKLILFKSEYPSDNTYNSDIIDYLNSREDITYEQMVTILTELGFKVSGNNVTW